MQLLVSLANLAKSDAFINNLKLFHRKNYPAFTKTSHQFSIKVRRLDAKSDPGEVWLSLYSSHGAKKK